MQRQPSSFFSAIGGVAIYGRKNLSYEENDTVYTVVRKIAQRAANVPLYVYKSTDKAKRYKSLPLDKIQRTKFLKVKAQDEIDESSKLAQLLSRPNQIMGQDAFLEAVFSFRVFRGEAFIWMNRGGVEMGEPVELFVLPVDSVAVVPMANDPFSVAGYILDINGRQIALPKEDVLHWKSFNPIGFTTTGEHLRGFDPMKPLKRRLQQDEDAMDAAVAMFQNGGARGVVYNETFDELSPEAQSQLKGVVDAKLNNKAVKSAVATLQGKWGYFDLGQSSVDMDLLRSQQLTLERIALALGIDPDVLIPGQSFSNKEWAAKKLITDTVMPLCNSLRDEINRALVTQFKGVRGVVDWDFSMLPELQEDYSKMIPVYASLFDRGAINATELRELLGFEPTTEPLHNTYMIGGNYAPLTDLNNPPDEPEPIDPNSKHLDYD